MFQQNIRRVSQNRTLAYQDVFSEKRGSQLYTGPGAKSRGEQLSINILWKKRVHELLIQGAGILFLCGSSWKAVSGFVYMGRITSLWGNHCQDDSRMFHWTAALKEEKLLFNFFKRLRFNTTDRYPEFRYFEFDSRKICHYKYSRFLSLCGNERNFIRCEDRPIVFHNSKILPTPSGVTIRSCQLGKLSKTF